MKFLVFLICLLLNPLVHGDIFESEQPVQSRIPMSLSHQATGTYGLVNQGKHNSLAKNYGGSESNAFFKTMMSKNTTGQNQIGGSQLGSISEQQTFGQIGSKEVSQSVNKNKVLGKTGVTSHGVSRKIQREITTTAELDALKNPLKIRDIKIDELGRPSQRFIGRQAEVVINPETRKILSVNPPRANTLKKLLAGLEEKV